MLTLITLFLVWLFAGAISGDIRSLMIWGTVLAVGAGVFWHEYRKRR